LLDRSTERARIDEFLELVRQDLSAVLVLRGCQGAGKTTLVDYAVGAASEFRAVAIAGVESEINLPYGAVQQLLIPFLPLIDELPVPHTTGQFASSRHGRPLLARYHCSSS
jgi:hypothetical protein